MTESKGNYLPDKPGVDIPQNESQKMWSFLVENGKSHFTDTAFVTDKPFAESDIIALKTYYQKVYLYQKNEFGKDAVFNDSLMEHYQLAERYVPYFAKVLGINEYLLQAVILTHDFGRLFSHRRGRNNAIEESLTKKIGFSEKFRNLLPKDTLWTEVDPSSVQEKISRLTKDNQGIAAVTEIIDVLAKWKDKEKIKLRRWENVVTSSIGAQLEPDPKTMWPSELSRQKKMTSQQGKDANQTKYDLLGIWFEKQTGLRIDDITKKVEAALVEKPLQRTWV